MRRFLGLLFFFKPVKMGKCSVPFGLHLSGQPHPPPPALPPAGSSKSPGMKSATLLASVEQLQLQCRRRSEERKGWGPVQALALLLPAEGSPFPRGHRNWRTRNSEVPPSPTVPPLSPGGPCICTQESPGGWLWGARSATRILIFSLPLPITSSFPAVGASCLSLSGGFPPRAKRRKEARRTVPFRGVILEFGCHGCFFLAGTHLPSPGWFSSSLGYVFGSGPSSGILPMPRSGHATVSSVVSQ